MDSKEKVLCRAYKVTASNEAMKELLKKALDEVCFLRVLLIVAYITIGVLTSMLLLS